MPTFGSLFAGIGGIDLGLERAGWTCRWQVEIDPFCRRVLEKHWPDVTRYGDVRDIDWARVEPVDLLAGGFPCQPVSQAGKKLVQRDDRWLWPEFARAIRGIRPRIVVVENVAGLAAAGGGFGDVLAGLADAGYDAEWDCVPAAAVGAPHLRYRFWIVAMANPDVPAGHRGDGLHPGGSSEFRWRRPTHGGGHGWLPTVWGYPDQLAYPAWLRPGRPRVGTVDGGPIPSWPDEFGTDAAPTALPDGWRERLEDGSEAGSAPGSAVRSRDGGGPGIWAAEPSVGRMADGVPGRVDRLRAIGNAVVPQVAEVIGRHLIAIAM